MSKTKIIRISGLSLIDSNPFDLLLDSDYKILSAVGSFHRYQKHLMKFTRKLPVRNEPRLTPIKTFKFNGVTIEALRQVHYSKIKQPAISKHSNGKMFKIDSNIKLEGKHFFKHFVSHFLKMNGGYKQETIYI